MSTKKKKAKKAVTKPAARRGLKPAARAVARSSKKIISGAKPVAKRAGRQVAKSVAKQVEKPAAKHLAKRAEKPASKLEVKQIAKPAVMSVVTQVTRQVSAAPAKLLPRPLPVKTKTKIKVRQTHVSPAGAEARRTLRLARMPQYAYMKAPGADHAFEVGDTVEVFCDHEKNKDRIRGWVKGIVVQVDNKLVAVQFRSNVYLTDGWMVPDRILWFPCTSDQIRTETFAKKGSKKDIPDY